MTLSVPDLNNDRNNFRKVETFNIVTRRVTECLDGLYDYFVFFDHIIRICDSFQGGKLILPKTSKNIDLLLLQTISEAYGKNRGLDIGRYILFTDDLSVINGDTVDFHFGDNEKGYYFIPGYEKFITDRALIPGRTKRNISERVEITFCNFLKISSLNLQLERSKKDLLTGLLDRRSGRDEAKKRLSEKLTHGSEVGYCIYIDIDDFKKLNDTYGHACGDKALTYVANIIRHGVGESDVAFRAGGEEVVVYCPHNSLPDTELLARALCVAIKGGGFTWNGEEIIITASIGVSFHNNYTELGVDNGTKLDLILDRILLEADAAMYYVKKTPDSNGKMKDGVITYHPDTMPLAGEGVRLKER